MERRITVIGHGSVSAKPDYIEISMKLETKDKNYNKAMGEAAKKIGALTGALESVGFTKDDVKTSDFSVGTLSEYKGGVVGRGKQVDAGFKVSQRVKVGFDLDMKRLSQVMGAISRLGAPDPDLSVYFTVKDPSAVQDAVLKSAAESARRQAEVLCSASGTRLGELVSINYSWTEIRLRSKTTYCDSKSITMDRRTFSTMDVNRFADMRPDDIDARDDATFVWAIE